jgi:hypothetical protein
MTPLKAVPRIEGDGLPLLVFTADHIPGSNVWQCWSPFDGHNQASRDYIRRKTRPATPEESAAVKRRYETGYDCSVILKRRLRD